MLHARSHTLLAARAARFDTPLDGVFANVRDGDAFERDTALSRRLGYRGRKLIHPSQIEPCNRLYRPSEAELDYYARVLEAFKEAVKQGSASTTVDGRMIDVAMANAAQRALDAAAAWKKAG
jgi:citrate lyase subunit beta/citryl-CoA lyase